MIKRSKLFNEFLQEAEDTGNLTNRTKSALNWMRKRISTQFSDRQLTFRRTNTDEYNSGNLYLFQYDPKNKNNKTILPYYDKYPLCLILEEYEDSFLALNFHYLRPTQRAEFMSSLYDYEARVKVKGKVLSSTVLDITYNELVRRPALKYYKPCIKRYLLDRVILSPFYRVPSDEWNYVLFLPTEKFIGASSNQVWLNSSKLIR